jgi:hypothetical protein
VGSLPLLHFTGSKLRNIYKEMNIDNAAYKFYQKIIISFYYSGIKDWNSLPESVKNCNNKNRFKTNVKKYLMEKLKNSYQYWDKRTGNA